MRRRHRACAFCFATAPLKWPQVGTPAETESSVVSQSISPPSPDAKKFSRLNAQVVQPRFQFFRASRRPGPARERVNPLDSGFQTARNPAAFRFLEIDEACRRKGKRYNRGSSVLKSTGLYCGCGADPAWVSFYRHNLGPDGQMAGYGCECNCQPWSRSRTRGLSRSRQKPFPCGPGGDRVASGY